MLHINTLHSQNKNTHTHTKASCVINTDREEFTGHLGTHGHMESDRQKQPFFQLIRQLFYGNHGLVNPKQPERQKRAKQTFLPDSLWSSKPE